MLRWSCWFSFLSQVGHDRLDLVSSSQPVNQFLNWDILFLIFKHCILWDSLDSEINFEWILLFRNRCPCAALQVSCCCCCLNFQASLRMTFGAGWGVVSLWYKVFASLSRKTTSSMQSAGTESWTMMAWDLVCQNFNPFSCALARVDPVDGVLRNLPFVLVVHFSRLRWVVVEVFSSLISPRIWWCEEYSVSPFFAIFSNLRWVLPQITLLLSLLLLLIPCILENYSWRWPWCRESVIYCRLTFLRYHSFDTIRRHCLVGNDGMRIFCQNSSASKIDFKLNEHLRWHKNSLHLHWMAAWPHQSAQGRPRLLQCGPWMARMFNNRTSCVFLQYWIRVLLFFFGRQVKVSRSVSKVNSSQQGHVRDAEERSAGTSPHPQHPAVPKKKRKKPKIRSVPSLLVKTCNTWELQSVTV